MNNLYHWHDERMVDLEMREVNRAVEQARLLREAGLSGESWLARAVKALSNLLRTPGKSAQDCSPIEPQSYQSGSNRLAR